MGETMSCLIIFVPCATPVLNLFHVICIGSSMEQLEEIVKLAALSLPVSEQNQKREYTRVGLHWSPRILHPTNNKSLCLLFRKDLMEL